MHVLVKTVTLRILSFALTLIQGLRFVKHFDGLHFIAFIALLSNDVTDHADGATVHHYVERAGTICET